MDVVVFGSSHHFQMLWVDARLGAAGVVKLRAGGDCPAGLLEDNSVLFP